MKTLSEFLIAAGLLLAAAASSFAATEQDLIAILQSSANAPEKCSACQQLRTVGTAKSVPALSRLLADERVGHAARYALEGMPFQEALAALRDALRTTSGPLKAGLIDSLGWRHDTTAVPLLVPMLRGNDAVLSSATATALGRIGGPQAVAALQSARAQAPTETKRAVLNGLLLAAQNYSAAGNQKAARTIFEGLSTSNNPDHVRGAAWRGLVLVDRSRGAKMVAAALLNGEPCLQQTALKMVREVQDRSILKEALNQWASLSAEAQLAVLDADTKSGKKALPTVRKAIGSQNASVRIAGFQAAAELGDSTAIPALANAAATGESLEREAARQALSRINGSGVSNALLKHLTQAGPPQQAELLKALAERGDKKASPVLLTFAPSKVEVVRLAALESLQKMAVPDTALPLLEMAAKSGSDEEAEPVLKAVYGVCQATADKSSLTDGVLQRLSAYSPTERLRVLPVLAELGTPAALQSVEKVAVDSSYGVDGVKQAIRVLGQWPNPSPAPRLLELSRNSSDPTVQVLALRSYISVAGQEPDPAARLALLQKGLQGAPRLEEKRLAIAQIGTVATPEALKLVTEELKRPDLREEAGLAAITIAEKLAPANAALARATAGQVLEVCKAPDTVNRALTIQGPAPGSTRFIDEWVVCGPYTKPGTASALDLFDVPFGPEKQGEKVEWHAMPKSGQVNLSALFPGQDNCAAYVRAQVVAAKEANALLLVGSDDGVKAWLNGNLVHTNNVDRGDTPDQDKVRIHLAKGTNELMLKITQGGGGWSAHARIARLNGQSMPGVKVIPVSGAPLAAAAAPAPAVTPVDANLPARDTSYRRLQLSDKFYTEGAYYADFNRDGKMDIVAGPFWFEGPTFEKRHEYRPVKDFDPKEYSDNFLTYTGDFNGEGWPDILCVPFPGKEGYWYENPAGKEGEWKGHVAYNFVGNESPVWGDVNGDGRPELVFCNQKFLGYAGPDPAKPNEPWVFHAVSSQNKRFHKFTHGVGLGDVNGDGRADIVEAAGWWEQPADRKSDQPWTFHPFKFAEAGAQMLVYDVDGDGVADVITAWHCHHYGLVWWQQVKGGNPESEWKQHVILSPNPDVGSHDFRVSQMHAFDLADMNGDGIKDVITGKRFWAHGPSGDKEPNAPAIIFWLELRRSGPGNATFVPHLIDDNSGVGTQVTATDLNGDGKTDVLIGNKKGIFVHLTGATAK